MSVLARKTNRFSEQALHNIPIWMTELLLGGLVQLSFFAVTTTV